MEARNWPMLQAWGEARITGGEESMVVELTILAGVAVAIIAGNILDAREQQRLGPRLVLVPVDKTMGHGDEPEEESNDVV